jgi:hypothetical protein
LAGGVEELTAELARGLCEPDVVLSEGACLFALECQASAEARGARPLATVVDHSRSPIEHPLPVDPAAAVVSCTSPGQLGAVFIEQWVGRCFGAAGAAALAAAIGAADGGEVPLLDADRGATVGVGRLPVEDLVASDGTLRAVVRAEAGTAHATHLQLTLPRP